MLAKKEYAAVESIIAKNGNCLSSSTCEWCPFKAVCLPPRVTGNNSSMLSRAERVNMAADLIAEYGLFGDQYGSTSE